MQVRVLLSPTKPNLNNMKKVIVILCFPSANVYVMPYNLPECENTEHFFETEAAKDLSLSPGECQWMVTTEEQVMFEV